MTINDIQDEIIEEFSQFDDWMDRYALLIDLGQGLTPMPETDKTEQNLIDGCQSKVWITARLQDGKIQYAGDSDALLVKGLVALVLRVLSNQTPADILATELYFMDKIQLREHLSPTRSNGLAAMIKQMKLYALAFSQELEEVRGS